MRLIHNNTLACTEGDNGECGWRTGAPTHAQGEEQPSPSPSTPKCRRAFRQESGISCQIAKERKQKVQQWVKG